MFEFLFKTFHEIREVFWNYPELIFGKDGSLLVVVREYYRYFGFLSHLILSFVIYVLLFLILVPNVDSFLSVDESTFVEGTVVGVDENGNLRNLKRINPLINSNIQLEKDISELIYDSLLRVNQNGDIVLELLAEEPEEIRPGNHYKFKLKEGVKWHDGDVLTTKDVAATMNLLRKLNKGSATATVYTGVVENKLDDITIIDDYSFELRLRQETEVLPTFFEDISFKILPEKYISELDERSILEANTRINIFPIGTGPFRYFSASRDSIRLLRNNAYYGKIPDIGEIKFTLYESEEKALNALKAAQIHALAGTTSSSISQLEGIDFLNSYKSNVIYNQYWALFFNLSENSDNEVLKDKKVRNAINLAIDKGGIVNALFGLGEVAYGPIPKNSFAFNENLLDWEVNKEEAMEILLDDGWQLDSNGVLEKDGEKLKFSIVLVENTDRSKVARYIKKELREIGIEVTLVSDTIQSVYDSWVLPKAFEVLLYGQTTFVDPDRFEFFHSSQIGFPQQGGSNVSTGLNITSYESEEITKKIDLDKDELVEVSRVDRSLEVGKSFISKERRREQYIEFQRIVNEDMPVVFLYHPIYSYGVNRRVSGINLEEADISKLEERFIGVENWSL